MSIVFLQPFGIGSPGGGSRILRALLQDAPVPWTSAVSSPQAPHPAPFGKELHIASRPSFGRVERSRFHSWCQGVEPLFAGRFRRRLRAACQGRDVVAIHSIPHSLDFIHAWEVAQSLGLKFFLTVHDDLLDTVGRHPFGHLALKQFPEIWRGADARFVISEQLGREYCQRYGERSFQVVTDGLRAVHLLRPRPAHRLNIYFMGLFHLRYTPNLRALLAAVERIRAEYPGVEIRVRMRCGRLPSGLGDDFRGLDILPFSSESDVEADLDIADLLYLPLPFGEENNAFVRHSLSTKMITYLGSGIPILFHGPRKSAAYEVLASAGAALASDTLDPESLSGNIAQLLKTPNLVTSLVTAAQGLARQRFMLEEQRGRFWREIMRP